MNSLSKEDLELILTMCMALDVNGQCNRCEHNPACTLLEDVQVSTLEAKIRRMLHDK